MKDNYEYVEGGRLRDRYGRVQYSYRTLHQALAPGDSLNGGTVVDADFREQIVINDLPSGTSLPEGWRSVIDDFGAAGDGATDDRQAFQDGVDWITSHDGTLYIPPFHTYAIYPDGGGGGIVIDSWAWRITGGGPWSRLLWKGGAGTGPMIWVKQNPFGPYEMDHFCFDCDVAAYDGPLLLLDSGVAGDAQQWSIHDCDFQGFAKAGIKAKRIISSRIDNCRFQNYSAGTAYGFWLDMGYFMNVVQISNCMFAAGKTAHIYLDNNDVEMCSIGPSNTFEAGTNTPAIVTSTNCHTRNLIVFNNWCGDNAANHSMDWFQMNGTVYYQGVFAFNHIDSFAAPADGDVTVFKLGAGDYQFFGNETIGADYVFKSTATTYTRVGDYGNKWQSPGKGIWGTSYANYQALGVDKDTILSRPYWWTPSLTAGGFTNNLFSLGAANGNLITVTRDDALFNFSHHTEFTGGVGLPVGTILALISDCTVGQKPPYFTASAGVTLNSPQGISPPRFRSAKSVVYAWQQALDVWYLFGDLATMRPNWEYAGDLTFSLGNENNIIVANDGAGHTYTVPKNATAAFAVGTEIDVIQGGAGQVTIAPEDGTVTLRYLVGLKTAGQGARIKLWKRATNEWVISGDLAA